MSHLTLEALARLVDEAPDAAEAAHLESCAACGSELVALREQSQALSTLPSITPPPDAWPALRRRLRNEGLLRPGHRWRPAPAVTRAAAAAVLFLAGGAAGWAVRGPVPPAAVTEGTGAGAPDGAAATASAPAPDVPAGSRMAGDRPATPALDPAGGTAAGLDPAVRLSGGVTASPPAVGADEVDAVEEEFLAALDRFMASTGTEASDPAARLAALDNIVLTTAEALNEAPADPVINSYFLMAQAQRQAVLRQIEATAGKPVF